MSFGGREDELWGVLKPTFKPRVFGDPNLKYAERLLNQRGVGKDVGHVVAPHADPRAVLARVVRKAPEVLVKVTGRKKGADHLGAHLAYIGRKGEIALETCDGELLTDKADVQQLAEEWSETLYWRQRATVSAVSMVFSMPEGTDPETVRQSVRETVERMLGDNHDYLMALHTDTPRPHVHMTVEAEGMDGKRFDPRREDLFKFREAFAEALRSRGVECEATPRWTRGQGWHEHGACANAGENPAWCVEATDRSRFATGSGSPGYRNREGDAASVCCSGEAALGQHQRTI